MVSVIKKEPLLKKMLIILFSSLFFMGVVFLCTQYYFMNEIYKKQIVSNQSIVGKLTSVYPEKETEIVKIVLNEENKKATKAGKEVLKRYGYDENVKIYQDDNYKKYFYNLAIYDVLALVIVIIINTILFLYGSAHFTRKLEDFSGGLDKIMDGDFSTNIYVNEEGILSRIGVQFEQMAKRLEMSFEKLQQEKENIKSLVTDISHQLKTPVASIKLFNSLLLEEKISNEERNEFLNRSKGDINKLEWLIGSLIKISRLEANMIELKKEKGNIKETIIEAVNEVYLKALQKNIDIDIENVEDCIAHYDLKWTKEAIFNILENAVKYTGTNGQVYINMIQMESYIKIDIEDNGIGIPKEETNSIFKRFYRGNSKKVKQSEGSGVGLYLTRKILEEQGGNIIVSSKEGIGTKFSLFLQNC